jgi:hypothetical protein
MDVSRSVTATFTTKPVLSVTVTGNGKVTSSPAGIDCGTDCDQAYDQGTDVTLTADPDPGSEFDAWGGACSGSSLTCLVDMDSSKSVTATFTLQPLLTVEKSGDGDGTVTSSPAGIDCDTSDTDCTERYPTDTEVILTANPAPDLLFVGWSGGGCTGTTPCTLTMDTSKTVTADFDDPLISAPSNRPRMFDLFLGTRLI